MHGLKRNSFIIFTPDYDDSVGGICALHYLADRLTAHGEKNVFLTCNVKNPNWNGLPIEELLASEPPQTIANFIYFILLKIKQHVPIKTIQRKALRSIIKIFPRLLWRFIDKETTIAIYPEKIRGNPLKAKHVVRWILNDVDTSKGYGKFPQSDHIFKYHDFYKVESEHTARGTLTAIDLEHHLTTYFDKNIPNRTGGAYLIRKGANKKLDKHPVQFTCADSIIDTYNHSDRAAFFNRIKTFISYDHMTFISIQAALCGCDSIIIPEESGSYTRDQLTKINPIPGIAYGFEEIENAAKTRPNLIPFLRNLQAVHNETIRQFIAYCRALAFKNSK